MKKIILIILTCIVSQVSFGANSIQQIQNQLKENKTHVSFFYNGGISISINSNYGSDSLTNLNYKNKLKGLDIIQISLVYSNYKESGSLSQNNINENRLKALLNYDNETLLNSAIQWNTIVIVSDTSLEMAKNTFHGFVIQFANSEEAILDKVINGSYALTDYLADNWTYTYVYSDKDKTWTATLDLAIVNTLERNKGWKDMLIVTDLTGSMLPYTAQLLLWLKLNDKDRRAKSFVFFNDGDNRQDEEKIIGKTGGLYYTDYEELDQVIDIAKETSINGNGGDEKENDLEALIKGIKLSENIGEVVLIADNNAGPKDIELLYQIKKPIKIILCRSGSPFQLDYLNLAKATGGSIHTIEDDLDNMMVLNEGEVVVLNKVNYKIQDGLFIEL